MAREASDVVSLLRARFEVLALDALVAAVTERVVEYVVMMRAVGIVVEHVEISGIEGGFAGVADEA